MRMNHPLRSFCCLLPLWTAGPASGQPATVKAPDAPPPAATIVVGATPQNPVSPLLFGQFLEIASWGELGPEAYVRPVHAGGRHRPARRGRRKLARAARPADPLPRAARDLPITSTGPTRIRNCPGPGRPRDARDDRRPPRERHLATRFTYDRFLGSLRSGSGAEPLARGPGAAGRSWAGPADRGGRRRGRRPASPT